MHPNTNYESSPNNFFDVLKINENQKNDDDYQDGPMEEAQVISNPIRNRIGLENEFHSNNERRNTRYGIIDNENMARIQNQITDSGVVDTQGTPTMEVSMNKLKESYNGKNDNIY